MDRNVGATDRTVRVVVGILLGVAGVAAFAGYWAAGAAVGAVAVLAGLVLFFTGTTRKCPIYAGTGLDTTERGP